MDQKCLETARQFLAGSLLLCTLALPGCGGDDNFSLIPNPSPSPTNAVAASLRFRVQPALANAGAPIQPAVQVEVLDAGGQPVASGAPITLFLGNNPTGAGLAGATATTVDGVATFPGLSVSKPGTGYTLVATGAGVPPVTSNPFNVALPGQSLSLFNNSQSVAIAPALGSGTANSDVRIVVAGDFNGDNFMDQALIHGQQNNLRIQTRRADGGYDNRDIAISDILHLAAGDMDGDGDLDLVAVRSGNRKSVFFNNGDGSFAAPVDSNAPNGTRSLALFDVDGNGSLDIVTTGTSTASSLVESNLAVLFPNNGSGGFANSGTAVQPITHTANRTRTGGTVLVGDFNGSGSFDIAVMGTNPSGSPTILAGNENLVVFLDVNPTTGAATSSLLSIGVTANNLRAMAAGDIDGDGDNDLVVAVNNGLRIFSNNGAGLFPATPSTVVAAVPPASAFAIPGAPTTSPFGLGFHNPGALAVTNLDSDAAAEIAFLDTTLNAARVFWSAPGASNPETYQLPAGPAAMAAADYSGDGNVDLGVVNRSNTTNSYSLFTTLLNRGGGNLGPVRLGVDSNGDTARDSQSDQRAKLGDVNGDGISDIVLAVPGRQEIHIWQGASGGSFSEAPTTVLGTLGGRSGSAPVDVLLADVDGANGPDLVVLDTFFGETNIRFFLNNGSGGFTEDNSSAIALPDSLGPVGQGAVLNADGDAAPEFVLKFSGISPPSFLLVNGSYPYDASEVTRFPSLAVGDFVTAPMDATPGDEIVAANSGASSVVIFHNDGTGVFPTTTTLPSLSGGSGPVHKVAVGDLNGDGVPDIAATQGNGGSVAQVPYWISNGSGFDSSLLTSGLVENGASATSNGGIAIGDVNGDGLPDIVVGGQASTNINFFLNRGSLLFQNSVTSFLSGRLSQVHLADLNADGVLDVVGVASGGVGGVYPLIQQ